MIDGISGSGGSSLQGLISNLSQLSIEELDNLGMSKSELDTILKILTKMLQTLADGFQIEDIDILKDCLDELGSEGFSSAEVLKELKETLKVIEEFVKEMIEKGVSVQQINKLMEGTFDLADHVDEELQMGVAGAQGDLGSELALTNEAEKMAALLQMRQKLEKNNDLSGAFQHNLIEKASYHSSEKHHKIEKSTDLQEEHGLLKEDLKKYAHQFSKLEQKFTDQLTTMITTQTVDKLFENSKINNLLDAFDSTTG